MTTNKKQNNRASPVTPIKMGKNNNGTSDTQLSVINNNKINHSLFSTFQPLNSLKTSQQPKKK